jgi:hypothetical protein
LNTVLQNNARRCAIWALGTEKSAAGPPSLLPHPTRVGPTRFEPLSRRGGGLHAPLEPHQGPISGCEIHGQDCGLCCHGVTDVVPAARGFDGRWQSTTTGRRTRTIPCGAALRCFWESGLQSPTSYPGQTPVHHQDVEIRLPIRRVGVVMGPLVAHSTSSATSVAARSARGNAG